MNDKTDFIDLGSTIRAEQERERHRAHVTRFLKALACIFGALGLGLVIGGLPLWLSGPIALAVIIIAAWKLTAPIKF